LGAGSSPSSSFTTYWSPGPQPNASAMVSSFLTSSRRSRASRSSALSSTSLAQNASKPGTNSSLMPAM
jgi:hypothetical protein